MQEILTQYLEFLWGAFQYDMDIFSQGWLYYWVLVPAAGYLCFFFIKWVVITAPIWLPFVITLRALRNVFKKEDSVLLLENKYLKQRIKDLEDKT